MKRKIQFSVIKTLFVFSLLACGLSITGCSEDSDPIVINESQTALMAFGNLSPDSPNLTLSVGNALVQSGMAYLDGIDYQTFTAGSNQVVITETATGDTLIDTTVVLQGSTFYSLFAIDSLSDIQPAFFTDNLTTPGSGNCNVRFINLSPNSQTISLQPQGNTLPWFPFYSFPPVPASASYNFAAHLPGLYNFDVLAAGTSTVLFTLPNIALVDGGIYTMIAYGFEGGTGVQAFGLTLTQNN